MERKIPTPHDLTAAGAAPTDEAILEVVGKVQDLPTDPTRGHVEAFENAHRVLQEHLTGAVDG